MGKPIAWIDEVNTLTVEMEELSSLKEIKPIIKWQNHLLNGEIKELHSSCTAIISFPEPLPLGLDIQLIWGDKQIPVYARNIVRTPWFEETYDASDALLGASYSKTETAFSVWAPTATRMILNLNSRTYPMIRQKTGVWSVTVSGNWNEALYYFEATINGEKRQVNDPYAKSLTANSEYSVVLDLPATDPVNFRQHSNPSIHHVKDAIIYELHVRDATMASNSGVSHKGKFLGLTERNTMTSTGHSTGISYIRELGCTHVQLLPVNDFARVNELEPENSYNWGYDPLFFQVPEGSYATNPALPTSRVNECKQMIQAFHEEGLSVILDVVYNHVFEHENSVFEKLVPGYFFRYHEDGTLSNGTGTGNDIATERPMVRKFILDSIDYWLKEYRVDGFRFDLMGEMDIQTMKKIKERCDQESEQILLLGEGWELNTPLPAEQKATIFQSHQLKGISFFNDKFRDSVKGSLFEQYDQGYANGKGRFVELLPGLISGSCVDTFNHPIVHEPSQSVNYVECHDNHTLWDKLQLSNEEESDIDRKKIHQLATGITLLSQGIPFIHAGQEWFRTKHGDENSYISGDATNQLNWQQRAEENDNIEWIKALIAIRKQYHVFRLLTVDDIKERFHVLQTPAPVFGFMLFGDNEDLSVFINPTKKCFHVQLPSPGRWEKLLSNYRGGLSPISCIIAEQTEIKPYEIFILRKPRI